MPTPSLKAKLPRDGCAFGPMVFEAFSAAMPAIVASTGADGALFDTEHRGLRFETVKQMAAARLYQTALDEVDDGQRLRRRRLLGVCTRHAG